MNGIQYKLTNDRERGSVQSYHHKPQPLFLNKAMPSDVAGLKPATKRGNFNIQGADVVSKYTIGFEVEKNELSRGAVREYELFCGFERDGSCGYEAVTHILPLLPASPWRTKVYDMMHKAERIIDDRFSPSDKRCGGHITIAVEGMSGADLLAKVRSNAGLVLALFRHRLKNQYCGYNKTMLPAEAEGHVGGWHYKYQTALVKGNCVEFRIPSKFESVKQMMRRYELFYMLVDHSVSGGSFEAFLKKCEPIVRSMYNGDAAKTEEIFNIARSMQKFINTNRRSADIEQFFTR